MPPPEAPAFLPDSLLFFIDADDAIERGFRDFRRSRVAIGRAPPLMEDAFHTSPRFSTQASAAPISRRAAWRRADAQTGLVNWREGNEEARFDCSSVGGVSVVPAIACDRPSAPTSIPDGTSASKEDMLAAKKAVDAFKSGMEEYLACEKSSAKNDAAQHELVKVADRFNAQVKAFKAKG